MPNNDHNINTVSIEHSTGKHDKRRPPPCSWALNTFLVKTELTVCDVVTRLFLFLLLSLQVWVVLVLEHGLDISSYQSQQQTGKISNECGVEVEVGIPLETNVVSEEESNEDTRNDDVTQAYHCKVGGVQAIFQEILRKD